MFWLGLGIGVLFGSAGLLVYAIHTYLAGLGQLDPIAMEPAAPRLTGIEAADLLMQNHRAYLEAALVYADGAYSYDDVVAAVAVGKMQFWPGPHSAVVTELMEHPQHLALHIFLAGGNLNEIAAMTSAILDWGRDKGATYCYFTGRRGWSRSYLTTIGFEDRRLLMMVKRLDTRKAE